MHTVGTKPKFCPGAFAVYVSKEQADVLLRALELFFRARSGQLGQLLWELSTVRDPNGTVTFRSEANDEKALDGIEAVRSAVFPELLHGESYGVRCDADAGVAFDIYQTVRHKLAWTLQPNGGMGVSFDEPLFVSSPPHPRCDYKGGGGSGGR